MEIENITEDELLNLDDWKEDVQVKHQIEGCGDETSLLPV